VPVDKVVAEAEEDDIHSPDASTQDQDGHHIMVEGRAYNSYQHANEEEAPKALACC
jgi:hypothetical protein